MKPASVGEMMAFLAVNFESEDIVKMLDLQPEELVYFLKDPIEEKFHDLIDEHFGDEETE